MCVRTHIHTHPHTHTHTHTPTHTPTHPHTHTHKQRQPEGRPCFRRGDRGTQNTHAWRRAACTSSSTPHLLCPEHRERSSHRLTHNFVSSCPTRWQCRPGYFGCRLGCSPCPAFVSACSWPAPAAGACIQQHISNTLATHQQHTCGRRVYAATH
jgi:hypothetical protein